MWAARAAFEREAEVRFRRLAADLEASGFPDPLPALARRAAEDEARHQRQCARLAERCGTPATSGPVDPPAIAPPDRPARQRALYDAVALCVVMETLSTALLAEMVQRTTDPACRAVVHAILKDEVTHSRIGWGALAAAARHEDVGWLGAFVPAMLHGTVQDEIFAAPEDDTVGPALEPFGGLRRRERARLLAGTARSVLAPGLRQAGIDPAEGLAWLEASTLAGARAS